jgi:hypothetical protein
MTIKLEYGVPTDRSGVARRIQFKGLPASQGELVRDMLDWFAASGAVPDESTVRRCVQALWAVLTKKKAGRVMLKRSTGHGGPRVLMYPAPSALCSVSDHDHQA